MSNLCQENSLHEPQYTLFCYPVDNGTHKYVLLYVRNNKIKNRHKATKCSSHRYHTCD